MTILQSDGRHTYGMDMLRQRHRHFKSNVADYQLWWAVYCMYIVAFSLNNAALWVNLLIVCTWRSLVFVFTWFYQSNWGRRDDKDGKGVGDTHINLIPKWLSVCLSVCRTLSQGAFIQLIFQGRWVIII